MAGDLQNKPQSPNDEACDKIGHALLICVASLHTSSRASADEVGLYVRSQTSNDGTVSQAMLLSGLVGTAPESASLLVRVDVRQKKENG